jgi:uncharacterized protein
VKQYKNMTNLTAIQPTLDRFKKSAHEIYGDRLVKILLYGSYARGEQHEDSDIDLLVVLKDETLDELKKDTRLFHLTHTIQMETGLFLSPIVKVESKFENDRTIFLHFVKKDSVQVA